VLQGRYITNPSSRISRPHNRQLERIGGENSPTVNHKLRRNTGLQQGKHIMPPLLHNIILSQPPLIQRSLGSNKRTRGIKNPYPYPYLTPIPTQKKMKEKKSIYIEVIKILAYFNPSF